MSKFEATHKSPIEPVEKITLETSQGSEFKGYDASTFCVYTASELVYRFIELHGAHARTEAEHLLDLAINSGDQCQIETWAFLIAELNER